MKTYKLSFFLFFFSFLLYSILVPRTLAYGEGCLYGTSIYGEECSTPTNTDPTPEEIDTDIDFSIDVADGTINVDIVDESGISVDTPSAQLGAITYSFKDQSTNGVLGTATEKIRLNNPTEVSTWSVTIAATDGISAEWSDGNGNTLDFNNPNGGQLSLNPSVGNVTEADGSSIDGISLGSEASFSEGVVDSITLYSANSSAQSYARYDLIDVDLEQTIPARTPATDYTLNLTITAL